MVNPSASSAYIAPRLTPLMTCWRKTSKKLISDQPSTRSRRYPQHSGLRNFGGHADIRSLRVQAVRRSGLVLVILEHAHHFLKDVAVRVERQLALQGLELGLLQRIAHVVAIGRDRNSTR